MKVKVSQSHSVPKGGGKWEERRVGEIIEIAPEEFAANLYEHVGAERDPPLRPARGGRPRAALERGEEE